MPLVKISDVPPFDGTYSLDLSTLNGRELHLIKQVSGVRGNELEEAMLAGDYDLLIALTLIAIERSGKVAPPASVLLDADVGHIVVDEDPAEVAQEGEQRPPESSPTPSGSESSNGVGDAESVAAPPSGAAL